MIKKFIQNDGKVKVLLHKDMLEVIKTEEGVKQVLEFWEKAFHGTYRKDQNLEQTHYLPLTEVVIKMVEDGKLIQTKIEKPLCNPELDYITGPKWGQYLFSLA